MNHRALHTMAPEDSAKRHVCPWWMGYLLASPLRRIFERPEEILAPLVAPGMTVVDVGSAMGYFSLPLARLVGPEGRVVCLDVQQRMLSALERRARRRGLGDVIETRLCTQQGLAVQDLEGCAGFVLAMHVVHETENPGDFIGECSRVLGPGGRLLVAEPRGHVEAEEYAATCDLVRACGLVDAEAPHLGKSFTALFEKPA